MAPHKTRFREAAVAYLKECAGTAGDFQQSANGIFEKEDMKRGGSRPVHHATTVAGWSSKMNALHKEDATAFRKNWNELCNEFQDETSEFQDETSALRRMINREVERLQKAAAAGDLSRLPQEDNDVRAEANVREEISRRRHANAAADNNNNNNNIINSTNEVIDLVESDDDNVVHDPAVVDNGAPNSINANNANEGSNVVESDDDNVVHDPLVVDNGASNPNNANAAADVAVAPDHDYDLLGILNIEGAAPDQTTPTLLQTTITAIMEALPSETYWMTTPDMK
jgi:hypothetical protein